MILNPDIYKLSFSRKRTITSHPSLTFNSIPVAKTCSQKHLGMR